MSRPSSEESEQTSSRRLLLQRLLGRLRHGLLIQEVLDRLGLAGLVIYPYYIVLEPQPAGPPPALYPRCTVRSLVPGDAAEMTHISVRPSSEEEFVARMAHAAGLGIFYEGKLAGYSWASLLRLPIPGSSGQALFELEPDEAYLFDIYVAPAYRGMRLAGLLRSALQHDLARLGRRRLYSLTLAFNRSSRRFKSRLGARETELRIYVHLKIGSLSGLDVRLWRREPHLKSPRLRRVLPAAGETPDA
jgi:ribosomal protein S18 acetylase RimI-like enzyme